MNKKMITNMANERGYSFYDYYIDDKHTENKYYIKNWNTGDLQGFDLLSEIYDYFKNQDCVTGFASRCTSDGRLRENIQLTSTWII